MSIIAYVNFYGEMRNMLTLFGKKINLSGAAPILELPLQFHWNCLCNSNKYHKILFGAEITKLVFQIFIFSGHMTALKTYLLNLFSVSHL